MSDVRGRVLCEAAQSTVTGKRASSGESPLVKSPAGDVPIEYFPIPAIVEFYRVVSSVSTPWEYLDPYSSTRE